MDGFRAGANQLAPPATLAAHLDEQLGRWPATGPFDVVGSVRRQRPGWDGQVCPAYAMAGPGGTVLSVPPDRVARAGDLAAGGVAAVLGDLGEVVGRPSMRTARMVFRWCTDPTALPEAGSWGPAGDPGVPEWLRPFGGEVLLATDDAGQHLGGVGIKRHDRHGAELAVVIARPARGRGLARRLVAQAARRVLDEGSIPTYLHLPDNTASARVADAAGFVDPGWTAYLAKPPESVRARLQRLTGRR